MSPKDDWTAWEQYVVTQLTDIHKEIATLKVKAGVWGLAGGMIPVAIYIAVQLTKK